MTTTEQEKTEEAYRINNPERPSLRIFPLRDGDGWFIFFMVGVAAWSNHYLGRIGITLCFTAGLALLFSSHDDRYWRVVARAPANWWIRHYHHGKLWRPGILSVPNWQFWKKLPVLTFPKVWYFETGMKEFPQVAIAQHPSDGSFSFVVVGDGSPLASYDLYGQHAGHGKFAELVSRAAATVGGMPFSASFHFSRRPVNVFEVAGLYTQTLHKDVLDPGLIEPPKEIAHIPWTEWADLDEHDLGPLNTWTDDVREAVRCARLHRVLIDELMLEYGEHGSDPVMAMICTIKPSGAVKDAARGKRAKRSDLRRHLLIKLMQTVLDGLRGCEVSNPRILDRDELHEFLRGSWDIKNINDYHFAISAPEEYGDIPLNGRVPEEGLHWPQEEITVSKTSISTDRTKHTVLRVTSLPGYLPPYYLRQIYSAPAPWLSVSVPVETASSMREVTIIDRSINVMDAFREGSGRVRQTRKQRKRRESLEDREERIYEARFKSDYSILICVSALSERELDDYVDEVKRHLREKGINCKEVKGELRQLPAMLSATTGLNLL